MVMLMRWRGSARWIILHITLCTFGMAQLTPCASDSERKPAVLFMQHPPLQREVARILVERGFEVDWSAKVTPQRFRKFNAVVLLQGGAYARRSFDALLDYVRDGGGLLICSWKGQHVNDFDDQFGLLDRLSARLRPEVIRDPKTEKRGVTPWGLTFAFTRNIAPSPVSEGVEQIWYPVDGNLAVLSMTMPYDFGDEWRIVVRGELSAFSKPWDFGKALPKERITIEGIKSAPPFFAIREFGRGRIAVCGINASFHFSGGYARALERIAIDAGLNGKRSDLLQLLISTLRWLCEPSLKSGAMGGATTPLKLLTVRKLPVHPPIDWGKLKFGPQPKTFRGIVGARTHLSVGSGTVADYAKVAKALGLDFIVFLEDFKTLPKGRWERLVRECEAVSTKDFLAVPGFTIEDGYGNHYFAIGHRIRYPEDDLLDSAKRCLTTVTPSSVNIGAGKPGQVGIILLEWCYVRNRFQLTFGSYLHSQNPCPYYEFRAYDAVALFTQDFTGRKSKLLDALNEGYLHLLNRGECLWVFAITFVNEPKQLRRVVR
ncbi:MAG TPA: hypothetical protein EYP10_00550, partial [Armatimonadetes bacterium]|nr:hypothetical protein [Armatimonadota bacterium]